MGSVFIARLTYTVPISEVDMYLEPHLEFLKAGHAAGHFLAWGPCEPRTSGLVFIRAKDRAEAETFTDDDPFLTSGVAERELIEWTPRFVGPGLEAFNG